MSLETQREKQRQRHATLTRTFASFILLSHGVAEVKKPSVRLGDNNEDEEPANEGRRTMRRRKSEQRAASQEPAGAFIFKPTTRLFANAEMEIEMRRLVGHLHAIHEKVRYLPDFQPLSFIDCPRNEERGLFMNLIVFINRPNASSDYTRHRVALTTHFIPNAFMNMPHCN